LVEHGFEEGAHGLAIPGQSNPSKCLLLGARELWFDLGDIRTKTMESVRLLAQRCGAHLRAEEIEVGVCWSNGSHGVPGSKLLLIVAPELEKVFLYSAASWKIRLRR
jgi:hypothetical protein